MKTEKITKLLFHAALSAVVFFAMVGSGAMAAPADTIPPLKDILRNTESHYQHLKAYTAHFRQKTTSAAASNMVTEASGRLYYQKPRQMRWEYEVPEKQIFVASREVAWLYVPGDRQVSLFEGQTFFASPLARTFFDGVFELRKQFDVNLDAKETTGSVAALNLIPKQEDPNVKSLRLWIDLQSYRVVSLETRDALGNTNRLVIDSQKEVPNLDPKLFQLDIPSGTAVIAPDGHELSPADVRSLKLQIISEQEKQ